MTFTTTDDAYVRADQPDTSFGGISSIQVDNSPRKNFLLKFSISGVNGRQVASAKLRLFAVDPSDTGGRFHRVVGVADTWTETTVTWNNAPAADTAALASLGKVVAGLWYEIDVASLVTGDGTVSLRVTSISSDGADYSSKEGANDPQLVVTLSSP